LFKPIHKNILITGGAKGIGRAIAKNFIKLKCKVTIIDIANPRLSGKFRFIKCDLSNQDNLKECLNDYHSKNFFAGILINCAAITIPGEAKNYSLENWNKSINVNLNSTFILCKLVGSMMIKYKFPGSIINVTSIGAEQGFENNPAYGASKGGIKQLTKSLASEWGKYGIRVNNLVPGYTNTPMNKLSWENINKRKQRSRNTILGRWANPDEMFGPVLFLSSDASSYVTGIDLIVDGGWTVKGMK
tara:strand:+ start:2122 stop:2856 length:735 start_codon:yes stop_codon:yes gene_type:complete